jgi:ankyrin repeat protein
MLCDNSDSELEQAAKAIESGDVSLLVHLLSSSQVRDWSDRLVPLCLTRKTYRFVHLAHRGIGECSSIEFRVNLLSLAVCVEGERSLEVVELLLNSNRFCNVNIVDSEHGKSALHLAAQCGNSGAIRLLLAVDGIDVNLVTSAGYSALHLAICCRQLDAFQVLLGADSIDVNRASTIGFTPLHEVASAGNEAALRLLLAADNVDVNAVTRRGMTPLATAVESAREARRHTRAVAALLQLKDVDVERTNRVGRAPVWFAARDGSARLLKLLLNCNRSIDERATRNRCAALQIAASRRRIEQVKLLAVEIDVLRHYERVLHHLPKVSRQRTLAKVQVLRRVAAAHIGNGSLMLLCHAAALRNGLDESALPQPAIVFCDRRHQESIAALALSDNDIHTLSSSTEKN